jgi:hypothetical protein
MALNLGKPTLALLWVGLSLSAVQAQPSAQNINSNVSLTLNSTTLLYSGQTVTVNFPSPFTMFTTSESAKTCVKGAVLFAFTSILYGLKWWKS